MCVSVCVGGGEGELLPLCVIKNSTPETNVELNGKLNEHSTGLGTAATSVRAETGHPFAPGVGVTFSFNELQYWTLHS